MQPLLAQELLKSHLADLLSEAEGYRRQAEVEATRRRWRKAIGFSLISVGSRLTRGAASPLPHPSPAARG